MRGWELAAVAIVVVYVGARLLTTERARRFAFVARFVTLALAGFLGEDTLIRLHHYYGYSMGWAVRLDQVPLVVLLVWPVVLDSAHRLARVLVTADRPSLRATVAAGLVFSDAALIEPVAVRAGLWRWTAPGPFGVPLVGIFGWAAFTWLIVRVAEARLRRPNLVALWLAPVGTHVAVVVAYLAVFRFISPGAGALLPLAWVASVGLSVIAWRGGGLPSAELFLRLPGALFFALLLGSTVAEVGPFSPPNGRAYVTPAPSFGTLVAYAAAFMPPYWAALGVRWVGVRSRNSLNLRDPRISRGV